MLRIVDTRPATAAEWDSAWEKCPWATPFQSRAWSEVLAATRPAIYRPQPLQVTLSDGTAAVLPFTRQQLIRGIASQLISSPLGTYGGWLAPEAATIEHGRLLGDALVGASPNVWWRVNPFDPTVDASSLPRPIEEETQVIDLASGFEVWDGGLPRERRKNLRRASREGVEVRRARDDEEWREYYQVYVDSLRRWGRDPARGYPAALFDRLRHAGSLGTELWIAVWQDRVIAGQVTFCAGRHVVAWHAGALEEYFRLRAMDVLTHEAIRSVEASGARWFDFNPSAGLEGVRRFKEHFGARYLPAPVVWLKAPLLTSLQRAAKRARRVRARLASAKRDDAMAPPDDGASD